MRLKFLVAAALAALVATQPARALQSFTRIPLVESRSYGTNTYSACVTLGQQRDPKGEWILGPGRVKTAAAGGAVTTVSAVDGALNVFAVPAAGDSIRFGGRGKPDLAADPYRVIATNADDDTITVNRAVDLDITTGQNPPATGFTFEYRTLSCSTSAGASYFPIGQWKSGNILLVGESESSATNGLDYQVEAYIEGGAQDPQIIASGTLTQANIAAGGTNAAVALAEFQYGTFGWTHLRLSTKVNGGSVVYSAYFIGKE